MHIAQLLVYRMNFNYRLFCHFIYEINGIFVCWFEPMMNKNINHSNFVSQKAAIGNGVNLFLMSILLFEFIDAVVMNV